jgi:uncharacterized damage-inducible protein DinB
MKKAELLAAFEAARAQTEAVIDDLTPEQLTTVGVIGAWTVKDILAHLTACEVDMVTNLNKAKTGRAPKNLVSGDAAIQKQNAQWYQDYKDRPLERVLADFAGVRKQTLRFIESASDIDLAAPAKWLKKSPPLWEYLAGDGCEHEAEHTAQIAVWRKERGF